MSAFKLPLRLSKVARYVDDSEGRTLILCDSRTQAAEIVEAVNSHAALMEAARALKFMLDDPYWQKRCAAADSGFGTSTPYGQQTISARTALDALEKAGVML